MATIRYMVSDVDQAVTFYTGLLGFEVVRRFGQVFAILSLGDLKLWLSSPGTSAARPMPDGRQPVPGGWNRFVIEVAEIEPLAARLHESGVIFRNQIIQGPGGSQVLIEDPSGNPIELFQSAGE